MIPFDYRRAHDVPGAVALVHDNKNAAFLAGGTNLVDHLRLGVANPDLLVDVSRLPLDQVETLPDDAVRIGASVRNSDLAAHPLIRRRYPVLSQALLSGASGQVRNVATTAGNLLQRTRCVYFSDVTTPCNKREPGTGCSAVAGYNRYHAVLGASPHCVAVHPSDLAVALVALDAVIQVQGPDSARTIRAEDLHRLPGDEPHRDTVLAHGELITAVDVPDVPIAAHSRYHKVRDRASFAFALVSVAAALDVEDGTVRDARVAFGGLAHKPWRARRAEEVLRGAPATDDTFAQAADAELADAEPLRDNAFKPRMARGALVATLRGLTREQA
jgi:xanthine dehydrogenase YagS FAD-binding subunit